MAIPSSWSVLQCLHLLAKWFLEGLWKKDDRVGQGLPSCLAKWQNVWRQLPWVILLLWRQHIISQRYNVSGLVGSAGLMHIVGVSGVIPSSSGRITILQHLGVEFSAHAELWWKCTFPGGYYGSQVMIYPDFRWSPEEPFPPKTWQIFLDKDSEL